MGGHAVNDRQIGMQVVANALTNGLRFGLLNEMREAADYAMISAAIFVDPSGSSVQEFHEDLRGFDRHAVWNVLFPIQLHIGVKHSPISLNGRRVRIF